MKLWIIIKSPLFGVTMVEREVPKEWTVEHTIQVCINLTELGLQASIDLRERG